MNALIFEKFGSADVLEYRTNLPQPLLKSDEILLEMKKYRRKLCICVSTQRKLSFSWTTPFYSRV